MSTPTCAASSTCTNVPDAPSQLCAEHICQETTCSNSRTLFSAYCTLHTCYMPKCVNLRGSTTKKCTACAQRANNVNKSFRARERGRAVNGTPQAMSAIPQSGQIVEHGAVAGANVYVRSPGSLVHTHQPSPSQFFLINQNITPREAGPSNLPGRREVKHDLHTNDSTKVAQHSHEAFQPPTPNGNAMSGAEDDDDFMSMQDTSIQERGQETEDEAEMAESSSAADDVEADFTVEGENGSVDKLQLGHRLSRDSSIDSSLPSSPPEMNARRPHQAPVLRSNGKRKLEPREPSAGQSSPSIRQAFGTSRNDTKNEADTTLGECLKRSILAYSEKILSSLPETTGPKAPFRSKYSTKVISTWNEHYARAQVEGPLAYATMIDPLRIDPSVKGIIGVYMEDAGSHDLNQLTKDYQVVVVYNDKLVNMPDLGDNPFELLIEDLQAENRKSTGSRKIQVQCGNEDVRDPFIHDFVPGLILNRCKSRANGYNALDILFRRAGRAEPAWVAEEPDVQLLPKLAPYFQLYWPSPRPGVFTRGSEMIHFASAATGAAHSLPHEDGCAVDTWLHVVKGPFIFGCNLMSDKAEEDAWELTGPAVATGAEATLESYKKMKWVQFAADHDVPVTIYFKGHTPHYVSRAPSSAEVDMSTFLLGGHTQRVNYVSVRSMLQGMVRQLQNPNLTNDAVTEKPLHRPLLKLLRTDEANQLYTIDQIHELIRWCEWVEVLRGQATELEADKEQAAGRVFWEYPSRALTRT